MPRVTRRASHAGSWYSDDGNELSEELAEWLAKVPAQPNVSARAIIGPHAGYSYCGHVMAYAYKHVDVSKIARVFILGPSHHMFTRKCLLSPAVEFATPLGKLDIDTEVYAELQQTGHFETASADVDEAEHSVELHAPYLKYIFRSHPVKVVPIIVGALKSNGEALYGEVLSKYLDRADNLFVISSDFCHWGSRFSYNYYEPDQGPIWKSIQWLDELGMKTIESGDADAFQAYLDKYKNTICGRHPIGVFLQMLAFTSTKFKITFQHYDQSSKCQNQRDSSVSYAAAVATVFDSSA